jgi:hypothetical protein
MGAARKEPIMELLDKAAHQAQELKTKLEAKARDVQARRKANEQLVVLGRLVYGERTARPAPDGEARVTAIVEALRALEADGVRVLPDDAGAVVPA